MFKNIKVIIWDFDGTFYELIPKLKNELRESEYRVIADHTGWSREKIHDAFHSLYKKKLKSATQVVAKLANISVSQAAMEMADSYDRTAFLKRDEKLIAMFQKLSSYEHYFLVNGTREKIVEAIKALGISLATFQEIVTAETVGDNKPNPKGFLYILKKTGLPPREHLMIGDRIDVDLEPAKKLGMKTCLVWSQEKNLAVDISIPTIYDVEKVIWENS